MPREEEKLGFRSMRHKAEPCFKRNGYSYRAGVGPVLPIVSVYLVYVQLRDTIRALHVVAIQVCKPNLKSRAMTPANPRAAAGACDDDVEREHVIRVCLACA